MRLSTRARYGVRAMFDLAYFGQGEPIALKTIAERQGISDNYLEQLIAPLRKAGLVNSVRGAQGGYTLGHPPEDISVGDILRVLEGPTLPVECLIEEGEEQGEHCANADNCITRRIWSALRDSIDRVLDSMTLADLCEEADNPTCCRLAGSGKGENDR